MQGPNVSSGRSVKVCPQNPSRAFAKFVPQSCCMMFNTNVKNPKGTNKKRVSRIQFGKQSQANCAILQSLVRRLNLLRKKSSHDLIIKVPTRGKEGKLDKLTEAASIHASASDGARCQPSPQGKLHKCAPIFYFPSPTFIHGAQPLSLKSVLSSSSP